MMPKAARKVLVAVDKLDAALDRIAALPLYTLKAQEGWHSRLGWRRSVWHCRP
jgi:hypothetical protein